LARVLSQAGFALRGPCPLGRALTYRSAPIACNQPFSDAAGQRLARNPLPRATPRRLRTFLSSESAKRCA